MYKGLGLNWRDAVISMLILFYVGLYQAQAQTTPYFNLDDLDTAMMLSYNSKDNNYAALDLVKTDYSVNITGIIAEVKLTQSYVNNSSNWIDEGLFAFPVAENAAVYQMKLIIGNRIIEGEIHEKKQAQALYDQAKSQGLSASLLKQYRPNLFTTDVANIMPKERVKVEISYQQTLKYQAGHIDFRLPLAIKNRYMQERFLASDESLADSNKQEADFPVSTVKSTNRRNIQVQLESGFELSELKSLYHDVSITSTDVYENIQLQDSQLYDSQDFVLRWSPAQGQEPVGALFSETVDGEEYALVMVLPPKNTTKLTQNRELIFVIDTSGSMHGAALNAAKDALYFGLTQLNAKDTFNIIEFNSFAKTLFKKSLHASSENLDVAIDFIDSLEADGGTNILPALELALHDQSANGRLKQVVFMTDGSVGNEAQIFQKIRQQIKQSRLFTVAIGAAPNHYFMTKAANIGRGSYTSIGNLNDVDEEINQLFSQLSSPALTNIWVDWNANVEQNPRIIPDMYRDEAIIITAKLNKFEGRIALSGNVDKKNWFNEFRFQKDGLSNGIAKLWARNQIEDLTDDLMLGADIDAQLLQQKITTMALKYHLVSDFTSLVAVDKTPDISRLVALQARALNQTTTQQVAFPQTALGWKMSLLWGLFFIGVALVNRKFYP